MIKTRLCVALVAAFIPRIAVADCIGFPPAHMAQYADVVFSGTVINITSNAASEWPSRIVTFEADQAWKGPVTKRFVVYSFTRTVEPFIFDLGKKYLVFAKGQTADERRDLKLGISEQQVYVVGQCGNGTREFASVTRQEIGELGPASRPAPLIRN